MSPLALISEHACFGGVQRFYRHASGAIGLPMRFGLYLPPQALEAGASPVPLLVYLAGLTCTDETFAIKAGAQQHAARLGLALLTPDTSPRETGIEEATRDEDLGEGAGFYLDATEARWSAWQMDTYITQELPALLAHHLPVDTARMGIFGHSMGGHGALTLALRHPGLFKSLSALAPVAAASQCPWGEKAFTSYLGPDRGTWLACDASALMGEYPVPPYPAGILVDQGLRDKFLASQLKPEAFEAACARIGQPLTLRRHEGYDHGYYFIQSFVEDHLAHHAAQLTAA